MSGERKLMSLPPLRLLALAFTETPVTAASPGSAPSAESTSGGLLADPSGWLTDHISVPWLLEQMNTYGPNLLKAVAIFVIGKWLAGVITRMIVRAARKARVDETLLSFLNNLIYMLLLVVVCISSLSKLGIEPTSLTAVLAAAGFAIGMALQGSLGNLAAGVMLVCFKPFRVGDVVRIGSNLGSVVEIQIFNTIILTLDNVRIIIPNANITSDAIENLSAERERRIDLVIGCGYNDDLRAVKATLQEIVDAHPGVLQSPAPVVAVSELGASSVDFVVRPWVLSHDYWDVRFDLTEQIKIAFDENGYTIPFPSRDLFLHTPAGAEQQTVFPKAA